MGNARARTDAGPVRPLAQGRISVPSTSLLDFNGGVPFHLVYAKTPRYTLIAVIPGRSPYIYLPPADYSVPSKSSRPPTVRSPGRPTPPADPSSLLLFPIALFSFPCSADRTHVRPRDGFSPFATGQPPFYIANDFRSEELCWEVIFLEDEGEDWSFTIVSEEDPVIRGTFGDCW